MSSNACSWILIALGLGIGCTESEHPAEPDLTPTPEATVVPPTIAEGPRVTPLIAFQPPHMSTDVGETPVRIVFVERGGVAASEATIARIAGRVLLESIAAAAPATVERVDARVDVALTTPDGMAERAITVVPSRPLGEGWYRLRLPPPSDDVDLPGALSYEALPGGLIGVRFRVGSQPIVTQIDVCAGGQIDVNLSEPVAPNRAALEAIEVADGDGVRLPCTTGGDWEAPSDDLYLACTGADLLDTQGYIRLPAGFVGASGRPLSMPNGDLVIQVDISRSLGTDTLAPGCRSFPTW